jgi:hypothetical protein
LTNVFVASTTISLYNFDFDNLFSYLFRLAKIVLRFMSIALYNAWFMRIGELLRIGEQS